METSTSILRVDADGGATLSIVIPALDEAADLPATLRAIGSDADVETIVVDGGSTDETRSIARAAGARLVAAPAGRAGQLNAGLREARGAIVLFLHADTRLPFGWAEQVRAALAGPGVVAGAFRLRIDSGLPGVRLVERTVALRSRWLQLPYGDQALFARRETLTGLGGYRNLEIMEDFDLVRRVRRLGHIVLIDDSVWTSGRRWKRIGVWRTTLINQLVVVGYHLGVPPRILARWYDGDRVSKERLASRLSDC